MRCGGIWRMPLYVSISVRTRTFHFHFPKLAGIGALTSALVYPYLLVEHFLEYAI